MPGIYISLYASVKTQKRLSAVLEEASRDVPAQIPQSLHITLAHDKETELLPQELSPESDPLREYRVLSLCAEHWMTKNGNSIIVASVISPELQERWRFWQAWGLHWDFPSYKPHFSLTDPIYNVPRATVAKWCRIFNETVQGLEYTFTNEYVQEVKEGSWHDPTKDEVEQLAIEENAAIGNPGTKKKAKRQVKIPVPRIPIHRPKLNEYEKEAMRKHGFNASGVEHRIHDLRSEDWKREDEEVEHSMKKLESLYERAEKERKVGKR